MRYLAKEIKLYKTINCIYKLIEHGYIKGLESVDNSKEATLMIFDKVLNKEQYDTVDKAIEMVKNESYYSKLNVVRETSSDLVSSEYFYTKKSAVFILIKKLLMSNKNLWDKHKNNFYTIFQTETYIVNNTGEMNFLCLFFKYDEVLKYFKADYNITQKVIIRNFYFNNRKLKFPCLFPEPIVKKSKPISYNQILINSNSLKICEN